MLYRGLSEGEQSVLEWAFARNESLRSKLDVAELSDEEFVFLKSFTRLLADAQNGSVTGVPEKLREKGSIRELYALRAELLFAVELATLGSEVHLILDDSDDWLTKSPDLDVRFPEQRLFVEVAWISGDDTTTKIRQALQDIFANEPIKVSIHRAENLAKPVIQRAERGHRDEVIDQFTEKLRDRLTDLSLDDLPVEFELMGSKVSVEDSYFDHGYLAGGSTDAFFLPEDSYSAQLKKVLVDKARKREEWDGAQLEIPYLIAVDSDQGFFGPYAVRSLLYGSLTYCPYMDGPTRESFRRERNSPEVQRALRDGWDSLLHDLGFEPSTETIVTDRGAFLRETSPLQHLAGVLCNFNRSFKFFPNPIGANTLEDLTTLIPWGIQSDHGV